MSDFDSGGGSLKLQRGYEITRSPNERYKITEYLGKGGFGVCYAAQSTKRADYVAVKIVEKTRLKERQCAKMYREIKLQRSAKHKNIVRLIDSFEHPDYFFIIMELCDSKSLLTMINDDHAAIGRFDEERGARYVSEIVEAVLYLSTLGILHRDLKPGNVLIGRNGEVKLGDFGLAIEFQELVTGSVSGTPNYLAPEVIDKKGHSLASEVWSIGCLIYCMLVGKPPFESDGVTNTYKRILSGVFTYPDNPYITIYAKNLIASCLHSDPKCRISIMLIRKDPWIFNNNNNYLLNVDSGYPLMRAKSTGNMLRDINGNVTIAPMPTRYRPKSATMAGANITADRGRTKAITASHDSGFGSESDFFKVQTHAYCRMQEKIVSYTRDLRRVLEGTFVTVASAMPHLFVTKWVDYSNRRGFGCKLTDGTLAVKFNEGACISWPRNSRELLYAQQPLVGERIVDAYGDISDAECEHIEVAHAYSQYMDRELRGMNYSVEYETENLTASPYIVHHYLDHHHLLLILSNGTVQINFTESKAKIIVWRETDEDPMGVAFFTPNFPPCAFRLVHNQEEHIYDGVFCHEKSRIAGDESRRFFPCIRSALSVLEKNCHCLSSSNRVDIGRTVQVTEC